MLSQVMTCMVLALSLHVRNSVTSNDVSLTVRLVMYSCRLRLHLHVSIQPWIASTGDGWHDERLSGAWIVDETAESRTTVLSTTLPANCCSPYRLQTGFRSRDPRDLDHRPQFCRGSAPPRLFTENPRLHNRRGSSPASGLSASFETGAAALFTKARDKACKCKFEDGWDADKAHLRPWRSSRLTTTQTVNGIGRSGKIKLYLQGIEWLDYTAETSTTSS